MMTATAGSSRPGNARPERDADQRAVRTDRARLYPAADGKLTFDKLSSVFSAATRPGTTRRTTSGCAPSAAEIADPVGAHVPRAGLRGRGRGRRPVEVTASNCVQCGAITAKGGRLTPPEGGSGPEYTLTSRRGDRDDDHARRRALGARGDPGRLHRTPLRLGDALELHRRRVFLKAELLQQTGSFKPRGVLTISRATGQRRRARRHLDLGGKPRPGARLGRGAPGSRRPLVMWAGSERAKIEATRAYGADGRSRGRRPGRGFRAPRRAPARDRPDARPSLRRPTRRSPVRARSVSSSSKTSRSRSRSRPCRRRRPRSPGSRRRRRAGG